ncbi:acetamidase/formamidase family protein [Aerococcaceae bacterium DSM 111176]|nr:acetamidase/formamidase family protein [Aerococcaceae bacterium DSM 111176]
MRITTDHVIFEMNPTNQPAAQVKPGERLVFETLDCFSNTVKRPEDVVSSIDFSKVNPATGPVFIEGAEVGDVLKVTIHEINLADYGAIITAPGLGVLGHEVQQEETVICQVVGDEVKYRDFSLPLRKMIGVIGTAPAGEGINTGTPGDHGGNMDTTAITEGATLYLPVNVDGALLALGDLHATMGDGEVVGAGLEIPGEVHLDVEVIKNSHIPTPFVETEDKYIAIASADTIDHAVERATKNLTSFIQQEYQQTFNSTIMLLSLAANVAVSQAVNPQKTARIELSKQVFDHLKEIPAENVSPVMSELDDHVAEI